MAQPARNPHRPLLSRYEIKYVISESLAPAVRAFIRPYMRSDPYAPCAGGSYPISSLYLDTPRLMLFRETVDGIKRRFKLRVRAYDDREDSPLFCEVKYRGSDMVRKTRVSIARRSLAAMLRGDSVDEAGFREKGRRSAAEFQYRVVSIGAEPRLVVAYDREAYESALGESVRVTMDRNLRYIPGDGRSVPVDGVPWIPARTNCPPHSLVLEVKFNGAFPGWVGDMVRHLEIRQRGFGKYVLSTMTHLNRSSARDEYGRQQVAT